MKVNLTSQELDLFDHGYSTPIIIVIINEYKNHEIKISLKAAN